MPGAPASGTVVGLVNPARGGFNSCPGLDTQKVS